MIEVQLHILLVAGEHWVCQMYALAWRDKVCAVQCELFCRSSNKERKRQITVHIQSKERKKDSQKAPKDWVWQQKQTDDEHSNQRPPKTETNNWFSMPSLQTGSDRKRKKDGCKLPPHWTNDENTINICRQREEKTGNLFQMPRSKERKWGSHKSTK